MNNLTIAEIQSIRNFNIYDFLQESGYSYFTSGKNVGSGWLGVNPCPYCGNENHFGVNIEDKFFNCWVCGKKGNLFSLVSKIKKIKYDKAKQFILNEEIIEGETIVNKIENIFKNEENNNQDVIKQIKKLKLPSNIDITSSLIKNNTLIRTFFIERGLKVDHAIFNHLKIGISGFFKNKLIIPIYYHAKLVAYQSRSLIKKEYHSEGEIKQYLYKIDKIDKNKKLIIVEGFFDYLKTQDFILKYYKREFEVTTAFSKILTDNQINYINELKPKELVFLLDNDCWSEYHKYDNIHCSTSFLVPPFGKDPGNMTDKDFIKMFRN